MNETDGRKCRDQTQATGGGVARRTHTRAEKKTTKNARLRLSGSMSFTEAPRTLTPSHTLERTNRWRAFRYALKRKHRLAM